MARFEVRRGLPADDVDDVVMVVTAGPPPPAGDPRHAAPVPETARVVHHVPERDGWTVVGHFGNVFAHVIVERELAVQDEQHDRRGSELLRDGASLEDRVGSVRNAVFEVGHPVRSFEDCEAVFRDADSAPRRVSRVPSGEDFIHTLPGVSRDLGVERQ